MQSYQYRKSNRPISQIPECICAISHNTAFCNRNVHICVHFCCKTVHCGIFVWCIAGFMRWIYYANKTVVRLSISITGLRKLIRWHLYIESGPWYPLNGVWCSELTYAWAVRGPRHFKESHYKQILHSQIQLPNYSHLKMEYPAANFKWKFPQIKMKLWYQIYCFWVQCRQKLCRMDKFTTSFWQETFLLSHYMYKLGHWAASSRKDHQNF